MANSIEVPVILGLETAQSQISTLRQMLQEGVQPDSRAFKEIINMLEHAATQAERLKQTMGESFKTSSGAKKFQTEMQKTFDLIATATGRLQNVSGKDLILSDNDIQKIQQFQSEIQKAYNDIQTLKSGKIGNVFDDTSKKGVQELQDYVKSLGQDITKLNFSDISKRLNKELEQSKKEVDGLKQKITELNNVINNPTISNSNSLITTLKDLTKLSTKKVLTPDAIIDAKERLNEYYGKSADLFGGQDKIPELTKMASGMDMSVVITQQIENTSKAIDVATKNLDNEIDFYIETIKKLEQLKKTKTKEGKEIKAEKRTNEAQALAQQLGLNVGDREKGGKVSDYIDTIIASAESELEKKRLSTGALESFKLNIEQDLNNIFSNLSLKDAATTGFSKGIRNGLESLIGEDGLKDLKVQAALNAPTSNLNTYFSNLVSAVQAYQQSLSAAGGQVEQLNAQQAVAEQNQQNLAAASDAVSNAQTDQANKVQVLEQEIERLNQEIIKLVEAQKQANATKVQTDPNIVNAKSAYENATNAVDQYTNSLQKVESKQKALSNVQMAVTRWMGFYQVLNLTKRAITEMKTHIQELDSVMTKIAVVTNMSQNDLWGQIGKYSEMARQYGVAIKGVYEVSQLYYQQGLQQGDVMNLTQETLKMARIAGIDYATAADYMTTAIRGFKLEMTDAAHVTDVFSALAASTASSTEELATAISKTAASAASVGSSFEATSAMMSTMISTTRESATNIGTALKSIISRYGEMKENMTGTDAEGEEYSLNKVDKALQTIGISIHDAAGQFRDFDDVILELAESWDKIDKNTQRYIATVMAGNRQQSRFLALVSNVDEYKRALEIASGAEDTGELQTLKTLDSIDAKIEQMKVTVQEFYTSSGIQDLYKGILDTITNVISGMNSLPKIAGKFPAQALAIATSIILIIKNVATLLIQEISNALDKIKGRGSSLFEGIVTQAMEWGRKTGKQWAAGFNQGAQGVGSSLATTLTSKITQYVGMALSALGAYKTIQGISQYGASTNPDEDIAAGHTTRTGAYFNILGSIASGAGSGALLGAGAGGVGAIPGAVIGGLGGLITGLISSISTLKSGIDMASVTISREIELAEKVTIKTKQTATEDKGKYNELNQAYIKLEQLKEASYESAEAMNEYKEYMNQLGDSYPELIAQVQANGDAIINLTDLEQSLANARLQAAKSLLDSLEAEKKQQELEKDRAEDAQKIASKFDIVGTSKQERTFYKLQQSLERQYLDIFGYSYNGEDIGTKINDLINFALEQYGSQIFTNIDINNPEEYADALINWQNEYLGQTGWDIKKLDLQEAINTVLEDNKDLTTKELLGFDLKTTEDYLSLSVDDYLKAVQHFQNRTKELVDVSTESIEKIDEAISTGQLDVQINEFLNANTSARTSLGKYISLFSYMIKGKYKNIDQIPTDISNDMNALTEWAQNNLKLLSDLTSLDVTQFHSEEALKAVLEETYNLGNEWQRGFIEEYLQNLRNFRNEINNAFTSANFSRSFMDSVKPLVSGLVSIEYKSLLLNSSKQYKELQENGLTIAAQNLENNLLNLLNAISNITDEGQAEQASTILKSIDLTDYDNIISAIQQFENFEDDTFTPLITILTNVAKQINTSVGTWVQKLEESAKETAENIQKTFENIGKSMDYASAYEEATKIADASKGKYTPTDLLEYSTELQGWVLNQKAIDESIRQITEERNKQIEKANTSLKQVQNIINALQEQNLDDINVTEIATSLELTDNGAQIQEILSLFEQSNEKDFSKWLEEYKKQQVEKNESELEALNKLLEYTARGILAGLNIEEIAGGTANEDVVKQQLFNAFKLIQPNLPLEEINKTVEQVYNQLLNGSVELLEKIFPVLFSEATKRGLNITDFEQYQNAISELLSKTSIDSMSEATRQLLEQKGYVDSNGIWISAKNMVDAANELLNEIKTQFDSVEDYNELAQQYLEKKFVNRDKLVYDFITGDITLDSITSLATSLGKYVDEFINLTTGEIQNWLNDYLTFDSFGGTYNFKSNISTKDFVKQLNKQFSITITENSLEWLKINEAIIESQTKQNTERNELIIKQREREEQTALKDALKDVTFINSERSKAFTSLSTIQSIADALNIEVDNLIGEYIAELDAYTINMQYIDKSIEGIEGLEELIAESIESFIKSIVDEISNGISGNLSINGKTNLIGSLTQLGYKDVADNLTFEKTVDGLKLSQDSAIQLYDTIKKIDAIQGHIVFDQLAKSLEESNDHFKSTTDLIQHIYKISNNIYATDGKTSQARLNQYKAELEVAKEILAVRATTEDSSYNFMSNDIPGGQKNPINYINNWAKAFTTIRDAAKEITTDTKGNKTGGFIDYQDWYNIANEMNRMAGKVGSDFEFAGVKLDGSLEAAAALINKGIDALTLDTSTGELKVSLGKMSVGFEAGAEAMGANVEDGIEAIADAEIKMLDGMISVLETIVAMEKLGDIDVEGNGIDLGEIFEIKYDENGKALDPKFWDTYKQGFQDVAQYILDSASSNKELENALSTFIINGHSAHELFEDAIDGVKNLDIDAEAYTAIMNALYQAAKSGNYDLDNIWQSVKEVLAGIEGFEGQIDVGDMHIAISNGIVLEAKDGKYIVGGLEFEYSQYKEACRAAMLEKIGAKGEFTKVTDDLGETEYQGTITVGKNDITVQTSGDKVKYYDTNGKKWDSVDQVIASNFEIAKTNGKTQATTVQEFAYEAEYKVAPKITNVDTSNISQTQINNLVGKSLKDLQDAAKDTIMFEADFGFKFDSSMTEEQLAELKAKLGIENKAIEMTIDAQAPTGDGANILAELLEGEDPITKTIKVNIESNDSTELENSTGENFQSNLIKLKALITEYQNSSGVNPNDLVNTLSACITSLNKEFPDDPTTWYTNLSAIITSLSKTFTNDPTSWYTSLSAIITTLSKTYTDDSDTWYSSLSAIITTLSKTYTDNPEKWYHNLSAIITTLSAIYTDDPNSWYNNLSAIITTLSKTYTNNPEEWYTSLSAVITSLSKTFTDNPEEWYTSLSAVITSLTKTFNDNPETWYTNLSAIVTSLSKTFTEDPNNWVNTLGAIVVSLTKAYKENPNDWISGLIAQISNINTNGADTALDLWRKKQEEKAITIKVSKIEGIEGDVLEIPKGTVDGIQTTRYEKSSGDVFSMEEAANLIASWGWEVPVTTNEKEVEKAAEKTIQVGQKVIDENPLNLQSALESAKAIYEKFDVEFDEAKISDFINYLQSLENNNTNVELNFDVEKAEEELLKILELIDEVPPEVKSTIKAADKASGTLSKIINQLKNIPLNKVTTLTTTYKTIGTPPTTNLNFTKTYQTKNAAKGNVALSKGRQTLMGELGPELYVTNGHYYVAGQNGAEFVNLPDDAIVFNHLQTRKLLQNGSTGRGKPITNEKKATSLATGNAEGPAMASASEALAALKQLRAMWESIKGMSIKDLAGAGGGGGGGGGKDAMKAFVDQVERWYNLLQKIARLEADITHEEKLRAKLESDLNKNGAAYYASQKKSLQDLIYQMEATQELLQSQKDYRQTRIEELNENGTLQRFYTFDSQGNWQFNDKDLGYKALADLVAQGVNNAPVHTLEEQVAILESWGLSPYMEYDSNGEKIEKEEGKEADYYSKMVEAAWTWIESGKEEIENLNDSINDNADSYLELMTNFNTILNDIRNNQLELEDKIYDAIVDSRQQAIDDAQKSRDALEKSSEKFIDGLQNSLNKEKQMYENEQNAEELNKMRRRLGILQRTGGSASSIRSLQEQITQKEKDAYFDAQQEQIDAIKEASDLEIERLDAQIELMTETLEYQKENGLLWNEVASVMTQSPTEIQNFIQSNSNEWKNYSTTRAESEAQNLKQSVESWANYRDDVDGLLLSNNQTLGTISDIISAKAEGVEWNVFDSAMEQYLGDDWAALRAEMKQWFDKELGTSGDATKAAAEVRETEAYQSLLNQKTQENNANNTKTSTETKSSSGGGGDGGSSGNNGKTTGTVNVRYAAPLKTLGQETFEKQPGNYPFSAFVKTFNGYNVVGATPTSIQVKAGGTTSLQIEYRLKENTSTTSNDSTDIKPSTEMNKKESHWKIIGTEPETGRERIYGNGYKSEDIVKAKLEYAKSIGWEDLRIEKYSKGGLNTYTGLAMLHGTPQKPESVFDAETTAILRNDILGHGDSLLSLLVDFKNAMYGTAGASEYSTINNNSSTNDSTVIEHVDVNLEIAQMASDYDARRAGNMIKDEMLKIARKTGTQNNIRG